MRLKYSNTLKKLLIATTNLAKVEEYKKFLYDPNLELVCLRDIGITQQADEIGSTLEENALIKARFYSKLSGFPAIADDGGFEIDALNGAPGVRSHRWVNADREDTDEEIIAEVLKRLKDVPSEKRGAQLRLVVAFVDGKGFEKTGFELSRGMVAEKVYAHPRPHFPYRSLLFFPELNKYYEELDEKESEKYNHRKRAVEEMKKIIREKL